MAPSVSPPPRPLLSPSPAILCPLLPPWYLFLPRPSPSSPFTHHASLPRGVLPAAMASPSLSSPCLRDRQLTRSPPVWRGTLATSAPSPHRSTHSPFGQVSAPSSQGSAGAGSFERPMRSIPGRGGPGRSSSSADLRGGTPASLPPSAPPRWLGPSSLRPCLLPASPLSRPRPLLTSSLPTRPI